MVSRIATEADIPGIHALQEANLYANLNKQERKDGFVTTPFTANQLKEIIGRSGLFVTEEGGEIIAYVFAGTWDYFDQWPIFPYMSSRFPELRYKDFEVSRSASFQYGPVCIAKSYRNKGVFRATFETMRLEWIKYYPLSVTFVNAINDVSEKAHLRLGWEEIDRFKFNGNRYISLAFDMTRSVLHPSSNDAP